VQKRIAATVICAFVLCYILTPQLVMAAEEALSWVLYPQTAPGNIYGRCQFQDKIIVVDSEGKILSTADGENWESGGDAPLAKYNFNTNGAKLLRINFLEETAQVSDDGMKWIPTSVPGRLYDMDGLPKFMTEPDWQYEVSDDGIHWKTIKLEETQIKDNPNFYYEVNGEKQKEKFWSFVKLNGRFYLFTSKGASIVTDDLENWTVNAPVIPQLNGKVAFFQTAEGKDDLIFCKYYDDGDKVLISKDALSWEPIAANSFAQWDGAHFYQFDHTMIDNETFSGPSFDPLVSSDGNQWSKIEFDNGSEYVSEMYGNGYMVFITTGGAGKTYEQKQISVFDGTKFKLLYEFKIRDFYGITSPIYHLSDKDIIFIEDGSTLVGYKTATVSVNGTEIYSDQPSILYNSRTLVPLRSIFEALGASVTWDEDTQRITGTKDDNTIILQIGSDVATVNDRSVKLDVSAKIMNDRTMVPARFIAESLGCQVDWDEDSGTVVITSQP